MCIYVCMSNKIQSRIQIASLVDRIALGEVNKQNPCKNNNKHKMSTNNLLIDLLVSVVKAKVSD